jgi:hypothetical protein
MALEKMMDECQQQEALDSQNVCICMFDEAK